MKSILSFAVVFILMQAVAVSGEEPGNQTFSVQDLESGKVKLIGESGLPIGTAFRAKLKLGFRKTQIGKIREYEKKVPVVFVTLANGHEFTVDQNQVSCFYLDPRDKELSRYDGQEVVAYETLGFGGYPDTFWEGEQAVVQRSRQGSGFGTQLTVRFVKVAPGRVPTWAPKPQK